MSQGPPSSSPDVADILLVDDDPKNVFAIEAALGPLGRRLVKCGNGEDALRLLLRREFALILLDVQLPTIDGFETARLIRMRKSRVPVPIIFITAFNQAEHDMRRGYELGAVDYLFKPIVPEILCAKAQVFVELRARTEEVARQASQLRELERLEAERRLQEERRQWEAQTLRKQMEEMADADKRKDEFIAMLAHELRNPLAPLAAGLELMRKVTEIDPNLTRTREAMERQVRHLSRILDDLLDVLRISQGKFELRREIVDVAKIVTHAVDTCRPALDKHGHRLVEHPSEEPVRVNADPVRLTQVLANLVHNAVRYTDPGGVIEIAWQKRDDNAVIRVRDTGRGIPLELTTRIFDMFVQERPSGRGLGLGLTLVKQLVTMHGGEVTVRSEGVGHGSEFEITLPLAVGVPLVTQPPQEESLERSLRIALVEDDEDVRSTMRSLLEVWGHRVLEADSGPAAVTLLTHEPVDVALMDIGLPGYDGYEAARRIIQTLNHTRPRLIALSGYGRPKDVSRSSEAGFDAHLVKPVAAGALKNLLAKISS